MIKTFRFKMDGGALQVPREAQGRDWKEALEALGYGPQAMMYLVISYEVL
jgi:hypothetical protein